MASNAARAPRLDATDLPAIYRLVASDFHQVNALIPYHLTSEVELVEEIGEYIVRSGGKRLRPLIVLLVARCCGYGATDHVRLATIIEFLHTATLLHDDVVDGSEMRRGLPTANARWDNAPSVLVGDFLYSRAFQLMVELDRMDILNILADATNVIAEGEVLQLDSVGNADLTEEAYMEVVRCKTALLFQASAHTAAVLATNTAPVVDAMRDYGLSFGLAYQLVDDWLEAAGLQRRGPVGHGIGRLARARDIVRIVSARLRGNETVFLHPRGCDRECDEAWSSLGGDPAA